MKRNYRSHKMPDHARAPNVSRGAWILYRLHLKGITQSQLANELGVTQSFVSRVVCGLKTFGRVQKAIAKAIGFESWAGMIASGQLQARGGGMAA